MKKIITILAILVLVMAFVSCDPVSQTKTQTPATSSSPVTSGAQPSTIPSSQTSLPTTAITTIPEPAPTTPVDTLDNTISLSYVCKANSKNSKEKTSDSGKVTHASTGVIGAGDKITVQLGQDRHYIFFKLSSSFEEALIYVPGDSYTLTVPSDFKSYWPSSILVDISARYPSEEELTATINLALNPYDTKTKTASVYPHAYSNNNYNTTEFGAHCAIDGFKSNKAHGTYPYQSWGPNSTVNPTDTFMIDFGREVTVDQLITYIRADFSATGSSHDAYFSEYTVVFSDGSSIKVNPVKTADAQTFELGGKTTSSITITGFVTDKTNSQGWAGFTEVMVMGHNN